MKVLLLGGNGYIGSKFFNDNSVRLNITAVDLGLFGQEVVESMAINFNRLNQNYINQFDVIVCLAGHSSVQMCQHSPDRSWINNIDYFRNLCAKLTDNQRLGYASSASVYGAESGVSTESSPINFNSINDYDLQKITIDLIANRFINQGRHIVGLRFGTVNGLSPNTRSELMLNSMTLAALRNQSIRIKNQHIRRAILGINDVSEIVARLCEQEVQPGQYNLSSFNSTVLDLADLVGAVTKSTINRLPDDPVAYDFMMSNDKISTALNYKFKDTAESVVTDLYKGLDSVILDIRDNDRNFKNHL